MKSFQIDNDHIIVNTGRMYTSEGQIIVIARHDDGHVFADVSRMIHGKVSDTCPFDGIGVLGRYDLGQYDNLSIQHDLERLASRYKVNVQL